MSRMFITTATPRAAASIARSATSGVIFTQQQGGLTLVGVPNEDGMGVAIAFRQAHERIIAVPAAVSASSRVRTIPAESVGTTHTTCRGCIATPVGVLHMDRGSVV